MPPWIWMPSLTQRRAASPAAAFATWHARVRSPSAASTVIDAYCTAAVARSSARREVGELVLDRLERPDRRTELIALLRVREGHVEKPARRPHHLGRERDVRAVAPLRPSFRRQGNGLAIGSREIDAVATPGRVDGRDLMPRHRPRRGDDAYRRTGFDDRDHTGQVGVEHEELHRLRVRRPFARRPGDRDSPDRLARDDRVERRMLDQGEQRGAERSRSEEGAGRGDVAGLFDEHAQVGRVAGAESRELAEVIPQRRRRGAVVHVRAQERRGAFVGEQRTRGVTEELLIGSEGEVHGRYFLGSPRTRWAMMLRWISELPPAMVLAKLMKNMLTQRPAS